jgi:uncharacterized HAD superfamily protein
MRRAAIEANERRSVCGVTCVVVLTARAGDALAWSVEWLKENELPFDEIAGSEEAKKSLHGVDVLVDDYLGNVEEFLENASGTVVLVDQPWNRAERATLDRVCVFGSARRRYRVERSPSGHR